MGHGIGEVLARACPEVWLYDPDAATLERAVALIRESVERLERHGLIDAQVARDTPARVHTTADLEHAAAGAGFVIEAAPEDLATKQKLFTELDRLAPEDALLATNSSSFTLAQVAERVSERRRALVVGSHFFLPAQIVPLVEVSRGAGTGGEAFEAACALWERCGKTPIRVQRDVSGYVANRLQRALMREALAQVAEGTASAEDIDRAVRFGFGLRFLVRGPLAQRDVAGLDLASRIQTNPDDRERLDAGRRHLLDLAAAGHLGLSTGRGLLDWRGADPDEVRRAGDEALARAAALLLASE
jgi:3-hydroxybutyryl-CoA dehydrogenase